jgi:hypothetical protein
MPEINGTGNNSIQNMLESLDSKFTQGNSTHNCGTHNTSSFVPTNSTNAVLEELLKRVNTIGANSTSSLTPTTSTNTANPLVPTNSTADTAPAVQQAPPKKKKKKGFFGKLFSGIGKAFKKIGGFLKKALPIISTIAMFIPGIGTAVGMGLKIATAAMGAIDGIKSGNIFGALTSVAGAFTGGASGLLGKLGNTGIGGFIGKGVELFNKGKDWLANTGVGGLVTKGFDLFNKGKEWLSNTTAGLGGKVTDWLTGKGTNLFNSLTSGIGGKVGDFLKSNGADWIKNLAGNAGSSVTNWLNDKATSLFDKVTNSPFVQKARNFFDSGIGKSLLDFFTKKTA